MSTFTQTWVTGLFTSRSAAEDAFNAAVRAGYRHEDISVLMTDKSRTTHFAQAAGENRDETATTMSVGGAVGGSVVAVLAAIAATGTAIAFPGIGLVVAGPIAAALAGAGAGGATGGLIGAIMGAGIPERHAKFYHAGLLDGGIVIGVKAASKEHEIKLERWLERSGAEKVNAT